VPTVLAVIRVITVPAAAKGLAHRERAEDAAHTPARDQRAQRQPVCLGRVHADALRSRASPGEIQEQAERRLEQGSAPVTIPLTNPIVGPLRRAGRSP